MLLKFNLLCNYNYVDGLSWQLKLMEKYAWCKVIISYCLVTITNRLGRIAKWQYNSVTK